MEDYLINTTVDTKDYYAGNNQQQFIFKIYKNGNVTITQQNKDCRSGDGPVWTRLDIKDNIPLPEYVISVLKILLQTTHVPQTISDCEKCQNYYSMLINVIKIIKEQKGVETKQIDFYMKQTEEVENQLNEKNTYIENLENKYSNLSNNNNELHKKMEEVENQLNEKNIYIENLEKKYAESLKIIKDLKNQNMMKDNHIGNLETELKDETKISKYLESSNRTLRDKIMYCSEKCWCFHNFDCKL